MKTRHELANVTNDRVLVESGETEPAVSVTIDIPAGGQNPRRQLTIRLQAAEAKALAAILTVAGELA